LKLISSTFHPLLFAISPILILFVNNIYMVSAKELIIPLFASISFAIVLWLVLKLIIKNSRKSGIITSLFLILFFSYGHIFISANGIEILGFDTSTHTHFIIPFIIIFSAGTFFVLRSKRKLDNATKISNAISITLVTIAVINIGIFGIDSLIVTEDSESQVLSFMKNEINDYPDIYYIIFDAYANSDTLTNQYGFDNSNFIDYLKTQDFIIPSQSHGNYPITILSLSSSLNMQYVNDELTSVDTQQKAHSNVHNIINNNAVMKNLKEKGYKIISFNSGSWITNSIRIADWNPCSSNNLNSEFIGMLVRTTMLYPIHVKLFEHDMRDGINCIFEELPKLREHTNQPIFVFAHIMIPHPPYIFGVNGETVDPESLSLTEGWDNRKGYTDQVQYTNKKIKNVLDEMLSDEYSPIIIIQSDHGPRDNIDWENPDDEMYDQVFGILNVYHLPNGGNQQIYETISPINSFRVIFNYYFDDNYELLDDKAYFHNPKEHNTFNDVTSNLQK